MKKKATSLIVLAIFMWSVLFVGTVWAPYWLITPIGTWDPQNPIGSWWNMPDNTQRYIFDWDDTNGDAKVSPCDWLKFAVEPGVVTHYWHVGEVGPDNNPPDGPDYMEAGRPEDVPEFPLGAALEMTLLIAVIYVGWKTVRNNKQVGPGPQI